MNSLVKLNKQMIFKIKFKNSEKILPGFLRAIKSFCQTAGNDD